MKYSAMIRNLWLGGFLLLLGAASSSAQLVRTIKSASPVNMGVTMALFRQDLGGTFHGAGGSYTSGYREIDWEDSPSGTGIYNHYHNVAPRGAIFNPVQRYEGLGGSLRVSQDNFSQYHTGFTPYSGTAIMSPVQNNFLDISFVIPGTSVPASVKGFGIVFLDIDNHGLTWVVLYDEKGEYIETLVPEAMNNGYTFIGVSYTNGKRISRVSIRTGEVPLYLNQEIDFYNDKVALDNVIFGEPRAIEHHQSDFDGDGTSDTAVFRPSDGKWYVMQSGTNTLSVVPFGAAGDIPVDGDFDGDSRSDYAVFRPSTGVWYTLRSSDLQTQAAQFGMSGDKPVPGDYDKDGLTDIAVWRGGMYWILQSSNGEGVGRQFGLTGDIPIGAAMQ